MTTASRHRPVQGDVKSVASRHLLVTFYVLTFAIVGILATRCRPGRHLSHFPGLLGSMLAAFFSATWTDGPRGVVDLLARMARWRVSVRWYAASVVPALIAFFSLTAIGLTGGELPAWEDYGSRPGLPQVGGLTVFLLVLVVNGFGEEVGWRGVAWPLLRSENELARSALYLSGP